MKMTKKAERAAEVAANKFAAYRKKVRALAGWVRVDDTAIRNAYADGTSAENFAVSYACETAVGRAIWPLKVAAVKAANKHAIETIDKMIKELDAAKWNLDSVAPYPDYRDHGHMAEMARMKYVRFTNIFSTHTVHPENVTYAGRDPARELRHVTQTEEIAADQYNRFVLKLVNKIGDGAVSATLDGNHVWLYSVLKVTMKDGTVQRWKTQQITNCSKLGLWFPQWPSRLMKAKG